jgi:hypothetical protein
MAIKEQIEQAASAYKDRVGTNYSGEYIMKDFTAGATWAIDNLNVNLIDEQSNLYVNEIARLRAALEKIEARQTMCIYGSTALDEIDDIQEAFQIGSNHAWIETAYIASEALKK